MCEVKTGAIKIHGSELLFAGRVLREMSNLKDFCIPEQKSST